MAFEKGKPKTGGRQKGTPNKRTREFLEILEEEGFCPVRSNIRIYRKAMKEYRRSTAVFEAMLERAKEEGGTWPSEDSRPTYLKIAQDAASDLMQYHSPKRKSIDHTKSDGGPLENYLRLTPEERAKRIAAYEKRAKKTKE